MKQKKFDLLDDKFLEQFWRAFKKVIAEWGVIELFFFIVFLPFSFIYLGMRVAQEWSDK